MLPLFIPLFITIRWIDIIDILLVAFLLYQLYNLIKGTGAVNIFLGLVAILFIWFLVRTFEMELLSEILGQFISVGVIALIIVFQQEIRQFLLLLGSPNFLKKGCKNFLNIKWQMNEQDILEIEPIVKACESMALSKTGALIVITRKNELKSFSESGEIIESKISKELIESIFYKNSPLHDGAVIINSNKLKAARCILPASEKTDLPPYVGLRHRAAIGITEESDAFAIVISEQRGEISIADSGELTLNIKSNKLREVLKNEFQIK
ncbi:MAG TPA: diadenylate cyclase CdaA [Bacteroidales bacterium]|nr:diadenylate cyclase CdaA [Bacteroidales bacterium]